jgi:hypothetical protein
MAERLQARGFSPMIRHRDLATPPSDMIEDLRGPGPAANGTSA